jgi:methionyl-tRNA formyltransferase
MNNIIFFGTSEFAVIVLDKLAQSKYKPVLVVTTPDMPAGRKQKLTSPPAKVKAQELGIPVAQPEKLSKLSLFKFSENLKRLSLEPELFVVASYGKILPKEVLDIPKYGTLNVHPSLLPLYRGPSPVQTAVLEGVKETGVSIMLLDEKMDQGPILASREYPNSKFQISNKSQIPMSQITTPELQEQLAFLGGELLLEVIPKWIAKDIKATEQDHAQATYTKIFTKKDGAIDWGKKAVYIAQQIRAFDPWPGTFTTFEGKNLKVLQGTALDTETGKKPGTVVKLLEGLGVQTGTGVLLIEKLQLEGKKPVAAKDFLLGHSSVVGNILVP